MNVLIVDDSKAMRLIVKRTLRQAGLGKLTVHEAENGQQALDKISQLSPELVLSDLNMPEMNGLDLLKAVRGNGNKVKFGLVTSEGSPEIRAEAMDAGANFMVVKPFTAEAFRSAIENNGEAGVGGGRASASGAGELPALAVFESTLRTLVRPKVVVEKGKLVRPDARRPGALVTWGADDGTVEVVGSFDLDLALALGAALTALPANTIDEHKKAVMAEGKLPELIHGNVHEVFNVIGSLFVGEQAGSGKLRDVAVPATGFPKEILALIKKPQARVDMTVKVDGYGGGGSSLFRVH